MFSSLLNLLGLMVDTFSSIFDSLSMNILDFMHAHENAFSNFLLDVMNFTGLDELLGGVTLAGFLFGNFMIAILVFLIIYVFIP